MLKIRQRVADEERVIHMTVDASIETWVGELGDRVSVSASGVQDRLIDLWGLLPPGDARTAVEQWLTQTLERELYTTEDVIDRLGEIQALQGEPSSVG
jgi:hypothetical protein